MRLSKIWDDIVYSFSNYVCDDQRILETKIIIGTYVYVSKKVLIHETKESIYRFIDIMKINCTLVESHLVLLN